MMMTFLANFVTVIFNSYVHSFNLQLIYALKIKLYNVAIMSSYLMDVIDISLT